MFQKELSLLHELPREHFPKEGDLNWKAKKDKGILKQGRLGKSFQVERKACVNV